MTTFNSTYDVTTPDGSDDPREADDRMREMKLAIEERLNVDHFFDKTKGTSNQVDDADTGEHRKILFHAPISATPTVADSHGVLRIKDVAGKAELFWTDEDGNDVQLTSGGNLHSSTGLTVAGNSTLTGTLDVTGNIDPTTYETTNGGFLDEDTMSSNLATATASQQSIKAYTDAAPKAQAKADNVPGATFGAGSESVTMPNGAIIKGGSVSYGSGTEKAVNFGTAFPGGILTVIVTPLDAGNQQIGDDTAVKVMSTTGFTAFQNDVGKVDKLNWIAMGY